MLRIRKYFTQLDGHMQEVLKSATSSLAIRVFGTLLGFVISLFVARMLGAEGVGVYYLSLSVATIASAVGRIGFDNTVIRFIASHASEGEWGSIRFVYRTSIKMVMIASLLVSITLLFSANWMANELFNKPFMEIPLRIVAGVVLLLSLAMIHAESLRGLKRIAASQWIQTVFVSLGTIVFLCPLIKMWGANGAVAAYAIAVLMTALAAWVLWRRAWSKVVKSATEARSLLSTRLLFKSSWPLFGVAITGIVMEQAAIIFLGIWGSVGDVGVFSIANRISSLLLFPLMAMISILAPKYSVMHRQKNMKGLGKLARSSSRILTFIVLLGAIFVFFTADWILALFGPEFSSGALILNILLVGVVVKAAAGAVAELLMMSGYQSTVRNINVFGAVITFIGCYILIPRFGTTGAAISVAGGYVLLHMTMILMVIKKLGFSPVGFK